MTPQGRPDFMALGLKIHFGPQHNPFVLKTADMMLTTVGVRDRPQAPLGVIWVAVYTCAGAVVVEVGVLVAVVLAAVLPALTQALHPVELTLVRERHVTRRTYLETREKRRPAFWLRDS